MTWDTSALDLSAYLARTGAVAEPPSLAALGRLQTAHVRTFPFENVDVLLDQHPGVSLEAVQDTLPPAAPRRLLLPARHPLPLRARPARV